MGTCILIWLHIICLFYQKGNWILCFLHCLYTNCVAFTWEIVLSISLLIPLLINHHAILLKNFMSKLCAQHPIEKKSKQLAYAPRRIKSCKTLNKKKIGYTEIWGKKKWESHLSDGEPNPTSNWEMVARFLSSQTRIKTNKQKIVGHFSS